MARDIGPDGVFINAAGMITMQGKPFFENGLTALAVRDGNIIAIGSGESILSMDGQVPVVDLERAVVMPGLIDSHNHFLSTALGWNRVQIHGARSIDQLLESIEQCVREAPGGSGSYTPTGGTKPIWRSGVCPRPRNWTGSHPIIPSTCHGEATW